jgi:hypothetical protein
MFLLVKRFSVLLHYTIWRCNAMTTCRHIHSLPKENLIKYRWHTYNRWQITFIPIVSSSSMTYATWLAHMQKSTIHIWHTSPLIPQVASVRLTLHERCRIHYENIFTSWGRDHKTSLDPHVIGTWSWLVAR